MANIQISELSEALAAVARSLEEASRRLHAVGGILSKVGKQNVVEVPAANREAPPIVYGSCDPKRPIK